ncbi:MAG: class I SAM-dependent methyltransferase [Chloroflexi bacterium]|nr:class I SAM-dependent methyltransferase [Chloroflexota bacterium]
MVLSSVRSPATSAGLSNGWPGRAIREPSRRDAHYLHLKRLVLTLSAAAARCLEPTATYRILDIGSGRKPYFPIFEPYAREYIGVDPGDGLGPDVRGAAEHLPFADASADVIVSTQVLEHVDNPDATVAEWRRVLRPGGLVIASTHGMYLYHPIPSDHWRWTHTGLRKLFERNGLRVQSLEACERTLSVLVMLLGIHASTFADHHGFGWLFRSGLAGVHALIDRIDGVSTSQAIPDSALRWGAMPCSYVIVAEQPSGDPPQDAAPAPLPADCPAARIPTLV